MTYRLYMAPHTCALASHLALAAAGCDFELVHVDMASGAQKSDDYRKLNPKMRVPTLIAPQGALTETPAILAYVAALAPDRELMPSDPWLYAEAQAFNAYLCSTVHVAHAHRMRGTRWADDPAAIEAMMRKVPQSVTSAFEVIEERLLRGPYVMGERYGVCDMYLFTLAQWLEADGVDLAMLPRTVAHRTMMAGRPDVQAAIVAEMQLLGAASPA